MISVDKKNMAAALGNGEEKQQKRNWVIAATQFELRGAFMKASELTASIDDGILNVRVGAIIARNKKILMVGNERSDYFYSVGGRIKFGESAEDAVVREVLEETGVHMDVEKLGFIHENFFMGDDAGRNRELIYEISFFFYMKVPSDFEPICESYTEDHKKEHLIWLDIDTDKKYFPDFFKEELGKSFEGVKHFVTRQCQTVQFIF